MCSRDLRHAKGTKGSGFEAGSVAAWLAQRWVVRMAAPQALSVIAQGHRTLMYKQHFVLLVIV